MKLKYGMNPHQGSAEAMIPGGALAVLNGSPGFINLLDALNAWQLVRDLKTATGLPAATSFKHVNPSGAAVGTALTDRERAAFFADDFELSPLAVAYVKARGADRMASFGDFIALSDRVDDSAAEVIGREVSDGIIAPAYSPEALGRLRKKKKGGYLILQVDPAFRPPDVEARTVFGVTLQQERNDTAIGRDHLANVVTAEKNLPETALIDLLVGLVTLKYTQSNSMCISLGGQAIGIGAGQQSRIMCTRLAVSKAANWALRQHPDLLSLDLSGHKTRTMKDQAVADFIDERFDPGEAVSWLAEFGRTSLSSDGYIPFADNIEIAHRAGIGYIAQPGQSIRDEEIITACNERGMIMAFTGLRLFHH
jgi:phosphoribosylaminoimidazolecarboxamide formyltransferase / IMP cyclohydrolase